MSYDNRHGFVSGLAAGGLFTLVLLVALHGASWIAHGDPGALFVRPDEFALRRFLPLVTHRSP